MAVEQRHIHIYTNIFCHRRDIYAEQQSNGSYIHRTLSGGGNSEALIQLVVRRHLAGETTAGFYPLKKDHTIRWVALDADSADGLEQLQQGWRRFSSRGVPAHLERSRRGGHLWIFFSEPVYARSARKLVTATFPESQDLEIYPKQDRLTTPKGVGSLLRGPLGIHRLTGERYPFVDPVSLQPVAHNLSSMVEWLGRAQKMNGALLAEQLLDLWEQSRELPPRAIPAPPRRRGEPIAGTPVEQAKQKLGSALEMVSRYVELNEKGQGSCPFHPPDNRPSFSVDPNTGRWTCFHEQVSGDALDFYLRINKLSSKEGIRAILAP